MVPSEINNKYFMKVVPFKENHCTVKMGNPMVFYRVAKIKHDTDKNIVLIYLN